MMDIKNLQKVSLFADFTSDELGWLATALSRKTFREGEVIIKEGEPGFSFYIVESGSVDVSKRTSAGEQPFLSTIKRGAIFGELALMGPLFGRSADVVAREDVVVLELTYSNMDQLSSKYPTLGVKIYRLIVKSLINKISHTTNDLLSIIVSSRMAALGEMASGVTHEINNPLSIMRIHSELIEGVVQQESIGTLDKKTLKVSASKITQMIDRISKIIKSVKALSHNAENEIMTEVEMKEILDQTLELCQARFKNQLITLDTEKAFGDIKIKCRPIQISQLILNLLNNAFDAVKTLEERWIKLEVKNTKDFVEISVTDSGKGIPPDIQKNLFESFFTTKAVGQGTGLGLNISKKIVQTHNGNFFVDNSSPNTRFVAQLPKS